MENGLGYFSQVPQEIVMEIFKYVIIEKKIITITVRPIIFSSFHTPLAFGIERFSSYKKEIKSLFFRQDYGSFANTCKAFNKIAKDKDMVDFIIKNSFLSHRDRHALLLYATKKQ